MKIGFMGKSLNMVSGHSKPVFALAKELILKGNEVSIITNELLPGFIGTSYQTLSQDDLNIITSRSSLISELYFKKNNIIKESLNSVDIIQLFDYIPPQLIRSILKYPIPIIYTLNGPWQVKFNDLLSAGLPAFMNISKPKFLLTPLLPGLFFKKLFIDFDRIISVSNYLANDLMTIGIPREKVTVIPLWVNVDEFQHTKSNCKFKEPTFLYFGWGSSIRGVPDVIAAFKLVQKKISNAKLILNFTGFHGIEEKFYQYLVEKYIKSDSIILKIGYNPNIFEIIKSIDVVILPFRSACGYAQPPLVILESMALGKCVISTRVGEVDKIISDGATGILVSPGNVEILAEKMMYALDNRDLADKLGISAREYIIKKHNLKIISDEILAIYARELVDFYG